MFNKTHLKNIFTGLNAVELSHLSPSLRSLFLGGTPVFAETSTSETPVETFTNGIASKPSLTDKPYTQETAVVDACMGGSGVRKIQSFDMFSECPREVEYYGFRTIQFDDTQREVFFDIKTGEIAFGSEEIIEAIPLDAIQSFQQIGEPTWGFMETKELAPWRQKLDKCLTVLEKAASRLAIGSVIIGVSAGLVSFVFPPALPIASFFLTKSLYPALAYYASVGVRKAVHFEKQVKFECVTKPELSGHKDVAGVRFTGTLPANEFHFVTEQLSPSSSPILV